MVQVSGSLSQGQSRSTRIRKSSSNNQIDTPFGSQRFSDKVEGATVFAEPASEKIRHELNSLGNINPLPLSENQFIQLLLKKGLFSLTSDFPLASVTKFVMWTLEIVPHMVRVTCGS
jgi:hypothetical protein